MSTTISPVSRVEDMTPAELTARALELGMTLLRLRRPADEVGRFAVRWQQKIDAAEARQYRSGMDGASLSRLAEALDGAS